MSTLQTKIAMWVVECFGPKVAGHREERAFRFIEESLELVQDAGMTKEQVLELVEYTYSRPPGVVFQEVGGVILTLGCLCEAHGLDMIGAGEDELRRVWAPEVMDKIRQKQVTKPHGSSLPGTSELEEEDAFEGLDPAHLVEQGLEQP